MCKAREPDPATRRLLEEAELQGAMLGDIGEKPLERMELSDRIFIERSNFYLLVAQI